MKGEDQLEGLQGQYTSPWYVSFYLIEVSLLYLETQLRLPTFSFRKCVLMPRPPPPASGRRQDELRKSFMLDRNGEECIFVVKNGNTTGVTIGRGTNIESFAWEYDSYDICSTSMEIATYPYNHKNCPRSFRVHPVFSPVVPAGLILPMCSIFPHTTGLRSGSRRPFPTPTFTQSWPRSLDRCTTTSRTLVRPSFSFSTLQPLLLPTRFFVYGLVVDADGCFGWWIAV